MNKKPPTSLLKNQFFTAVKNKSPEDNLQGSRFLTLTSQVIAFFYC